MNLKPAKDFCKRHVFELCCGGVIGVALYVGYMGIPFVYDGFPAVTNELKVTVDERLGVRTQMQGILNAQVGLDGIKNNGLSDNDLKRITFTDELTQLRKDSNTDMQKVRDSILSLAAKGNFNGRAEASESKEKDGKGKTVYSPLFYGKNLEKEDRLDPKVRYIKSKGFSGAQVTYTFTRNHYNSIFNDMTAQLTGNKDPNAGLVPEHGKLEAEYMADRKRRDDEISKTLKAPPVPGGVQNVNIAERDAFIKRGVMSAANNTLMYVDPLRSFQHRDVGRVVNGEQQPPSPGEIWEAYVDSWVHKDFVEAILDVNNEKPLAGDKVLGVARSRIPRLISIVVGNQSRGQFSQPSAAAAAAAGNSGQAAAQNTAPSPLFMRQPGSINQADTTVSMTGRLGNAQYVVLPCSITIVAEPAAVGKFINYLYQKNNGYTVLQRRDTVIDPYAAAGAGYLYGNRMLVQVELEIECLMFNSWFEQLVPEESPPAKP